MEAVLILCSVQADVYRAAKYVVCAMFGLQLGLKRKIFVFLYCEKMFSISRRLLAEIYENDKNRVKQQMLTFHYDCYRQGKTHQQHLKQRNNLCENSLMT